jgi:nucleoid-associated protein YgaU
MPRISKNSRLRFSQLRFIDGFDFWDLVEIPAIEVQPDDLTHTVLATDRPDDISFRYYGDTTLFPIIASVNGIELIPSDMFVGQVLRIPSPRYVDEVILRKRTKF